MTNGGTRVLSRFKWGLHAFANSMCMLQPDDPPECHIHVAPDNEALPLRHWTSAYILCCALLYSVLRKPGRGSANLMLKQWW